MQTAYCGVMLWSQAVKAAATTEAPRVREAMKGQSFQAPEGLLRIDPATQHAYKTPRVGQIRPDGQFEIVWTGARPEAPQPFPPSRPPSAWETLLKDLQQRWHGQWSAPREVR
jgi:urea transport system substrate-binding protein